MTAITPTPALQLSANISFGAPGDAGTPAPVLGQGRAVGSGEQPERRSFGSVSPPPPALPSLGKRSQKYLGGGCSLSLDLFMTDESRTLLLTPTAPVARGRQTPLCPKRLRQGGHRDGRRTELILVDTLWLRPHTS